MGNVFGFRSMPPRALTYAHPYSGVAIATPVLDLLMRQDNGVVTDRSPYGNNGVCSGCVGARGVFDEGQKFNGVANTINCGSNPSLDIAQNISAGAWIDGRTAAVQAVIAKHNGAASGWGLFVTAANLVQAYFNSGAGSILSANAVRGIGPRHAFFTVAGTVCRVFVDGLQDGRGAVVMSDSGADPLYIASSRGAGNFWEGLIELPQEWSGALSPEQVYKLYLSAGGVPIYLDDFSSYPVDFAPKAAGAMCGPYRIIQGSMQVVTASDRRWVQGSGGGQIDGTMQWPENNAYGTHDFTLRKANAAGFMAYSPIASSDRIALLTAGQNAYTVYIDANESVQLYRMTGAAPTLLMQTANGYVANGVDYDFKLVRRVGGQIALYFKQSAVTDWTLVNPSAAGTNPVTDNTFTAAPFALLTPNADNRITGVKFSRVCERPASVPFEFLSGTWAGVDGTWTRCVTAGVLFVPKDLSWQTMILGVRRGAAPNVLDTLFLASEIGSTVAASQNGYCLRMAADGSVQLIRTSGGIEAAPTATTVAGYTAITTEYEFKINRVWSTNAYQFLIRGGAYGATWTLMFAATLGIYTSSNYQNFSLTASDRITAPQFNRALL